jgi:hypothetical protein
VHFKTPIIVEENGEIKYQFVCRTYMFYFFLQSCLTFQTETLPLSSPGNARKIQPRTFCVMSNCVKAKLSMPRRASQTMHMVRRTARPNCATSSHFGFSNATDPSPLSTMSHYNGYSECFTRRWKPRRRQQYPEMSKKSVDKGRIGSYTKLCDFTLLFMILQVEL